jgi:hypothetical protein
MTKAHWLCMATFLIWAGIASAQMAQAPPVWTSQADAETSLIPLLPKTAQPVDAPNAVRRGRAILVQSSPPQGSGSDDSGQPGSGSVTAPETLPPAKPVPAEPTATPQHVEQGCNCLLGCEGAHRFGIFTGELQFIYWLGTRARDQQPIESNGVLGAGGSVVSNIGDPFAQDTNTSGGRLTLGWWQVVENPWVPIGIRDLGGELSFFLVGQRTVDFVDNSSPTIERPFFDVNDRVNSAFIVAQPGLANGTLQAHAQAVTWGAEANAWKNIYYNFPGTTLTVDLMGGFRFLDRDANLNIQSTSVFNTNLAAFPQYAAFAGDTLHVSDSFATYNRFYGGQVGISAKWFGFESRLYFEADAKLALGATDEVISIQGNQLRTLPGGTQIPSSAGLFALPSNIGSHHTVRYSEVPEGDLKFNAPLLDHLTLSLGFTVLYWSKLANPSAQINRNLDISQIPNFPPGAGATPTGLGLPNVPFAQSDLWLLGITLGLELNW